MAAGRHELWLLLNSSSSWSNFICNFKMGVTNIRGSLKSIASFRNEHLEWACQPVSYVSPPKASP